MLELKEVITAQPALTYSSHQPPAAAAARHPSEIPLKYPRYVSVGNLDDANANPRTSRHYSYFYTFTRTHIWREQLRWAR